MMSLVFLVLPRCVHSLFMVSWSIWCDAPLISHRLSRFAISFSLISLSRSLAILILSSSLIVGEFRTSSFHAFRSFRDLSSCAERILHLSLAMSTTRSLKERRRVCALFSSERTFFTCLRSSWSFKPASWT
ncbi:hypothetical protein EV421DRAFT_1860372 [Armillaria borealis]|uniref:Secreted protein n=1 Tax=Armillaria borealis TaxID=47425 RepID=A0AA39IUS5_9AGAR|nr:hypothetical protein EV421DRAFT_1860372 [Armillaria borealis]